MDTAPDSTEVPAGDGTRPAPAYSNARLEAWIARTSRPLDILALIFLAAIFTEWLFSDTPYGDSLVQVSNKVSWLVWFAFAVDYIVRLALASRRSAFVKDHKLDLLMVLLPFLRMLRVVLILRKSVARISTEQIASSLLLLVAFLVSLGALVEWKFEAQAPDASITTIGRSFWWAVVTTTTVGYGDEYPVTIPGRIVAVLVMMVGIGLIGTVSATFASWLVRRRSPASDAEDAVEAQQEAEREADLVDLRAKLDAVAAEQTRIRELLEELTSRER